MGVFNIFKKGFDPAEFEKSLTQLTERINVTEQQIYKLRSKSKRWTLSTIKYLVLIYMMANTYIYVYTPVNLTARNRIEAFMKGQSRASLLFVFGFPVGIVLLVKIIRYALRVLVSKREKDLRALKQKHKFKIEELKKITNFNVTNELINKYEADGTLRHKPSAMPKSETLGRVAGPPTRNINVKSPSVGFGKPRAATEEKKQDTVASKHIPSRRLQDRLLDILVGSDNNEAIESRFALICQNCYKHNGLALPGCKDPTKVKYICPYCGFPNGKDGAVLAAANDAVANGGVASPTSSREESVVNSQEIDKEASPPVEADAVVSPDFASESADPIPEPVAGSEKPVITD